MMRDIDRIIVHCSDTPDEREVTVDDIRQWHVTRGFSDIGYHYVIYQNGDLMTGRPVHEVGAHCKGYNQHSIGICLIGRKDFTQAQFKTLRNFVLTMRGFFGDIEVNGHNEFNTHKTCPNFYLNEVLDV